MRNAPSQNPWIAMQQATGGSQINTLCMHGPVERSAIRMDSVPQGGDRQYRLCVLRLTSVGSEQLATLPVVASTDGCRASPN